MNSVKLIVSHRATVDYGLSTNAVSLRALVRSGNSRPPPLIPPFGGNVTRHMDSSSVKETALDRRLWTKQNS